MSAKSLRKNRRSPESPAGTKTYTDSFYSCWSGDRTFIDNIGGVFTAVRNAAE